jgi:hypothetical protein
MGVWWMVIEKIWSPSNTPHHLMVTKIFWWGMIFFFSNMILHFFSVTKKFQSPFGISPPSNADRKGWGHVLSFWKKNIHPLLPYFTSWTIEKFRSPSNSGVMLDGN